MEYFKWVMYWVGVEISNDQMQNDQYFQISKVSMLKVTGSPVIRFFYLPIFLIFFFIFEHKF